MYSDFQKEMYGRDTLHTEHGFVVYKAYEDMSLYIHAIYVKKSRRDLKIGSEMVDHIVESTKCNKIYSYVDLTTENPELSIKAHLGYGFKVHKATQDSMSFVKEIIPSAK